jgi:RimJ/RimL family protein N-acetyltransferase
MPELITERLILRRFREPDLEPFAAICADPEVMRYASLTGQPLSRAQTWHWMCAMEGHWNLRGYGMWAVENKTQGRLIGRIGLQYPEGFPGIEIAWLLERESWGKGLAYEGARAALNFGFTELELNRLISLIYPENQRSIRLAIRLGESHAGDTELHGQSLLVYEIFKSDWPGS